MSIFFTKPIPKKLTEGFLDDITSAVKRAAKDLSSKSSAVTKIAGLRTTTYDEDIEDINQEIKELKTDKQKVELASKIKNTIKSLEMALDGFFEAKRSEPDSEEISVLIKGGKYYLDQFKKLLIRVEGTKVIKVTKKAIEKYSDEDDRDTRSSKSNDDY